MIRLYYGVTLLVLVYELPLKRRADVQPSPISDHPALAIVLIAIHEILNSCLCQFDIHIQTLRMMIRKYVPFAIDAQVLVVITLSKLDYLKLLRVVLGKESDGHTHRAVVINGDVVDFVDIDRIVVVVFRVFVRRVAPIEDQVFMASWGSRDW